MAAYLFRRFVGLFAVIIITFGFVGSAHCAEKPSIVTREQWQAKAPILKRMVKQTPDEIILHHSGVRGKSKSSLERKLRGLQGYSQRGKNWGDVPYHFYISSSGKIGEARDVSYAGDTNTKYSVADRIQVVLEGSFDKEHPTGSQIKALKELLAWLSEKYEIPRSKISAHNDHAQTICPGENFKKLIPGILAEISGTTE